MTKSTRSYTIDGVTYSCVEDIPQDVKDKYPQMMQMLEDKDGNGMPDVFDRSGRLGVDEVIEDRASFSATSSTLTGDQAKEFIATRMQGLENGVPFTSTTASFPGIPTPKAKPVKTPDVLTREMIRNMILVAGGLLLAYVLILMS